MKLLLLAGLIALMAAAGWLCTHTLLGDPIPVADHCASFGPVDVLGNEVVPQLTVCVPVL